MTPRVAILDYGCGNLASVVNAVRKVGGEVEWMTEMHYPAFTHIIIPGQGSFTAGAHLSEATRTNLTSWKQRGVPILGICLGMQLMCESSEEAPSIQGLGWFPYRVERLQAKRLPHVGWNSVATEDGAHIGDFYFCHSYAAGVNLTAAVAVAGKGVDRLTPLILGETVGDCWWSEYDGRHFLASVQHEHLWATQFHPEKSGKAGLELLAQFLAL